MPRFVVGLWVYPGLPSSGGEASTAREVWSSNESNLDAAMLGRLRLLASDNDVFPKGSNGVVVYDAATGQKRRLEHADELFVEAQARRVEGVDARGELLLAPVEDGVRVSLAQPVPPRVEIPSPPGPPAAWGSGLRPRPTSTGAGDGKAPPTPRR